MTISLASAEVRIRVEDRGRGIAPEDVTRIFDRFVQGEHPHDTSGPGG